MATKLRRILKKEKKRPITLVGFTILVPLILVISIFAFMLSTPSVSAQDDYNFDSENVVKGISANAANRNAEDGSYQSLTEADQYADTNYSGSSESMTYGTNGQSAFPSALNTDDATRRSYIEANLNPAAYDIFLVPTSDVQKQWDVGYPASPTTHYDKLDDPGTTSLGDSDTTYVNTATVTDQDWFGMSDMADPGAGYSLTVTIYLVHKKVGGTQSANIQAGIRIGTTNYQAITINPTRDVYTNTSGSAWTTNPAGGAWTYTAVNALNTYIATTDISPVPYTTKLVLKIAVTYPTANYQMQGTLTYSNVLTSSQTTGFTVLCQGYRSNTENFYVQAWNYTSSAWVTKTTINSASDTDFNFNLLGWAANCERSSGNEVQFRLIDVTGSDTTQDTLYLDLLKVERIEQGYVLEVEMTASTTNANGNQTLRIKGYTSAETFNVAVYNWTSSAYDTGKIAITALGNTQYTYVLLLAHHRSGSTAVKIKFTDGTASTADTTRDILYIDVAWVRWIHTNPTISKYGANPTAVNLGSEISFFLNYSDFDNEAPSANYPKVHIDATDYSMTNNDSYNQYSVGRSYHYEKSDLTGGVHDYYFIVDDANSGEITTASAQVTVNRIPTLTQDTVVPLAGNNGDEFIFCVIYTDLDNNAPNPIVAFVDANDYAMVKNNTEDVDYTDGCAYHYHKLMAGGLHTYHFTTQSYMSPEVSTVEKNLDVNNPPVLSNYGRLPADPVYKTDELNFTVRYTDGDNEAPTSIKWRETGISNLTMSEVNPADTTYTDGKDYYIVMYLSHGAHDYDYYTSDGNVGVSDGSNSVTIQNREPTIDNDPGTPHEYRNTYWEFDFAATDPDSDTLAWALSSNATFLDINSVSGLIYGMTSDPVAWYRSTVWANDTYTGSDSLTFDLYIDNQVPIISSSGNTTQAFNTYMAYHIVATDADADILNYALSTNASFLALSNAWVNGTVNEHGWFECDVWANDSYGGSDTEHWHLTVTNHAPIIASAGNTTHDVNTFMAYHIVASDSDGDTLSYVLSTNASSFLSISGAWVNGTCTPVGWYECDVWANDSYGGSDTEHWHLTVEPLLENLAPYFTSEPIYVWPNNTGYLYNVNAVDPESQPLYYDLFGDIVALGFCTIDHDTGQITGLPHLIGYFSANASVTDSVHIVWQNWSLQIYTNTPIIDSTPIETWQNGTTYLYNLTAHDPENELLTWDLEGNCTAFLSLDAPTGNITNLTGHIATMGWWYVNVSVFDGFTIVWQNFTLTALNTPPYFITSPILTGVIAVPYSYNADAVDINFGLLTYALVDSPGWMFVDPLTGIVEGTPVVPGDYDIHLKVMDWTNTTWQNWTLTISNPPPPTSGITESEQTACTGVIILAAIAFGLVMILSRKSGKGRPSGERKSEKKDGIRSTYQAREKHESKQKEASNDHDD